MNIWRYCTEIFEYLPLSAIIDNEYFCLHGGLGPMLNSIDDVRILDRKNEIPPDGAMCDLLWSDPEEQIQGYARSNRGMGCLFGQDIVDSFNYKNKISCIIRAHQLVMEGYL